MNTDTQHILRRLWDKSLVLRFQAGDDSAFAEIVAELQTGLQRYLTNVFHCQPCDAEDLLQDVWWEACRGLHRLREPAALRSWLYRIARNKALKFKKHRPTVSGPDDAPPPASTTDTQAQDTFGNEQLLAALADLPPLQREAVLLRYEQGLAYEEIAAAANCPVGTIRSRLYHARRQIKLNMKKESS